jgi:hypothetical protein
MKAKLEKLAKLCKGAVSITFNEHTTNYQTVEQYLDATGPIGIDMDDLELPPDIAAEMVKRDKVVEVQFYDRNPVGFYKVAHYDVETAVDQALEVLNND